MYTTLTNVTVNKIDKATYDYLVGEGIISETMIRDELWIFTDDQFLSLANLNKLVNLPEDAAANVIEQIMVNGTALVPDGNKVVAFTVPTKLSDLTNDSEFITNTVDTLVNYYKKTEVFSKEEVTQLVNAINTMTLEVVSVLPTENINSLKIYLVPKETAEEQNAYDEYAYINGSWEHLGDTQVDLTGYALVSQIPTKVSDLTNDAGYQANVLEGIKVNGTDVTVDEEKKANIEVPTAVTRIWNQNTGE